MNAAYRGGWKVKPGGVRVPDLSVINDDWEDDGLTVDWGEYDHDPIAEMVSQIEWTSEEQLRAHHAAYVRGHRDVLTLAGNREYDRRVKARRRADMARLDPIDREWCVRAAEAHFWASYEASNRHSEFHKLQEIAVTKTKTMLR